MPDFWRMDDAWPVSEDLVTSTREIGMQLIIERGNKVGFRVIFY